MSGIPPNVSADGSPLVDPGPVSVVVGIDTFSMMWRVQLSQKMARRLQDATTSKESFGPLTFRRTRGGGMRSEAAVDGLVYGVSLGKGLGTLAESSIWCEGRAVASGELSDLPAIALATENAIGVLEEAGFGNLSASTAPRVRRLDLAADFRLRAAVGQALLADLANLPLNTRFERKRVWTDPSGHGAYVSGIDIVQKSGITFRAYCKTTQQASAEHRVAVDPGSWVRLERQVRYDTLGARPSPLAGLDPVLLKAQWLAPFETAMLRSCTPRQARATIAAALAANDIQRPAAERLLGWLALNEIAAQDITPAATRKRRRDELHALGIASIAPQHLGEPTRTLITRAGELWDQLHIPTGLGSLSDVPDLLI